jgi:hypothetical protein
MRSRSGKFIQPHAENVRRAKSKRKSGGDEVNEDLLATLVCNQTNQIIAFNTNVLNIGCRGKFKKSQNDCD